LREAPAVFVATPDADLRTAIERALLGHGLSAGGRPAAAEVLVVDAAAGDLAVRTIAQAGAKPIVLLVGPETPPEDWMEYLGGNVELSWRSAAPDVIATRVTRLVSLRIHLRVLERAQRLQGQVMELAGRMDPTVRASTLLHRVGRTMMRVEGIVGAFAALGGPESGRSLDPILAVGEEARPATHQVRTALMEPGPRWHSDVGRDGAAGALCVIPLGQGPLGLLSLRLNPPDALPTSAAESLGVLLGRACAASLLVSSAKERQVRLERGYLGRVRELRRLTARVDRLSEIRDDFLAVLSHDLRSPLSIIQGNCQILSECLVGEVNDRQAKVVDTIGRQATRMTEMVEDLLDRFRAGTTPTPSQAELIALEDLASQVIDSHQDTAQEREIRLELASSQPASALADPTVLRQVLGNLLDNALKHCPAGSTVTVSVYTAGNHVGLEVRDDGPGFPKGGPELTGPVAARDHGMGLKLCHRLMRMMGGTLDFSNHPAGGAIARMQLPLAHKETGGLRVLVGSGELDRLEGLTERLGVRWDVAGLTHGETVLEQVRQLPPDVLILDHTLQGQLSGSVVLGELKGDPELGSVPVILLAPGSELGLAEQAHNLGALAVLELPLDSQELEAQIGRAARLASEADGGFEGRTHDPLTGLDTFQTQGARLQRLQVESREAGLPLPGLVVDVVDLKGINSRSGYAAGDQIVLWLSTRLRHLTRPGELLVRLASDEFLLVRPRSSLEDARRAADELLRAVQDARPRIGATRLRVHIEVEVRDIADLESVEHLHYTGNLHSGPEKDSDGA